MTRDRLSGFFFRRRFNLLGGTADEGKNGLLYFAYAAAAFAAAECARRGDARNRHHGEDERCPLQAVAARLLGDNRLGNLYLIFTVFFIHGFCS